MGLRNSFRKLPQLKGLTSRTGKSDGKAAEQVTKYVYEVAATTVKDEGNGLAPPPEDLAAPWASNAQKPALECAEPKTSNATHSNQQQAIEPPRSRSKAVPAKQDQVSSGEIATDTSNKPAPAVKRARACASQAASATARSTPVQLSSRVQTDAASLSTAHQAPASQRTADSKELAEASETEEGSTGYTLPPAIRLDQILQREPSAEQLPCEAETPGSIGGYALESVPSSGTVVVTDAHQAKLSLSLTASIEDYAKKADPANWGPPRFRKSQFVRVQPGTYAVPFKKLSEARSQYTSLDAYTKGTVHQINKETDTRDPREFVMDEGMVLYRIWIPQRVNSTVEFIFAEEHQMTLFHECTFCSAYATDRCSGCGKAWYCSEECQADDWRAHRHDCKHKSRAPPALGDRTAESVCSETPASTITPRPAAVAGPRRKFREDGTVKIINGYKPAPEELRGHTTIMPACLRPLTLEEEMAPQPSSQPARLLRAASHRLRRALHKKHMMRRRTEDAKAQASLEAALYHETIPEEDEEGCEAHSGDEEQMPEPERDGDGPGTPGAGLDNIGNDSLDQGGPEGPGHSMGGTEPDAEPGKRWGAPTGAQQQQRTAAKEQAPCGGNLSSGFPQRSGAEASPPHVHGLKPAKSLMLGPSQRKQPSTAHQITHAGSFNSIFSNLHLTAALAKSGAGGFVPGEDEASMGSYDSDDVGSPGAESLVEGQPPVRRQRRSSRTGPSGSMIMPQLPRIRVRPLKPVAAGAAATTSLPGFKDPQPWPIASAASLKTAALKKADSEAAKPVRSDSLPEVFKRLLSSSKQSPLAVRARKEDGSPSLKKAAKVRSSPFKRHVPGHRVTLQQPPPSL